MLCPSAESDQDLSYKSGSSQSSGKKGWISQVVIPKIAYSPGDVLISEYGLTLNPNREELFKNKIKLGSRLVRSESLLFPCHTATPTTNRPFKEGGFLLKCLPGQGQSNSKPL
jgi:hypothetical protein